MLVHIPGGEIELRDDRIKKQWKVEIKPFLLSKYLVTQDFYERITQQNPSSFEGKERPVEEVSWYDAIHFCNLLSEGMELEPCYQIHENDVIFLDQSNGFRLPSEAEWQWACQEGGTEIRHGHLHDIAWFKDNSSQRTHDVGKKQPNLFGLYDMLGNVWEWCNDIYDEEVYGSYRIFRGGGWNDEARSVMATNRRRSHPKAYTIDDLGFRLARSIF